MVQQILNPDIKLLSESQDSTSGPCLPRGCNKTQGRALRAQHLSLADHEAILDEIQRREVINFVEENDDFLVVSDEDPHSDSDDNSENDSDNYYV
jgi:hypothetical protein